MQPLFTSMISSSALTIRSLSDAHFPELVDDDRVPLAVRFQENPVENRRLSRAEIAGQERHANLPRCGDHNGPLLLSAAGDAEVETGGAVTVAAIPAFANP